jgi:hypothetical protein
MNSNLQNKLSRFEATPPGEVWDKIAEALDNENAFAQRLYNYREIPKTNIWEKIESSIEEVAPAKVVPFTTRYRKPIKYIAAAGILAVILVSATLLMKRTEAGSVETSQNETIPAKDAVIQKPAAAPTINSNNRIETAAIVQNNIQRNVSEAGSKQKRFLSFIRPQNIFRAIVLSGNFVPADVEQNELFSFSKLNDYMVYSDGDGNAMKVPKKLFTLVNCADGDGSCRERILSMQQKLSSASIPADFTGVLEMLRQLQ